MIFWQYDVMSRSTFSVAYILFIIIIIIIIIIKDPEGFWKKIDTKEKIVGVTITPSSPPEQKNR